ncbi:MAG TPA: metalloregulator ArsR/SmtB family transcription factor [Candidatus Aquicultor sp.]
MTLNQPIYEFKAGFFKALAHPSRIRILELLRDGEKSVNELQPDLKLELSNISQQLAVLRSADIVVGRKQGANVYYSAKNRLIYELLDAAKALFNESLAQKIELLGSL